jgi:hypothetical protein
MPSAGRKRGKEVRKRLAEDRTRSENAKKIVKRREQTQGFVENTGVSCFLSEIQTQNKPKTNSILNARVQKREQAIGNRE